MLLYCTCIQCQRSKVQRHTVTPLFSFPTPDARFDTVHINLVGPLPPSKGYTYLLTWVDQFTQWISLWCSLCNCHRSRTSVRVQSLERTHEAPRIETRQNNCLPPPVERHGGTFSLTAQSSTESSTQSFCMDGFSTNGTPCNPNGTEGRHLINSS